MNEELERIDKVIASLGYRITILANIIRPMVESGLADKPDDATDGRWVLDLEDYEYFTPGITIKVHSQDRFIGIIQSIGDKIGKVVVLDAFYLESTCVSALFPSIQTKVTLFSWDGGFDLEAISQKLKDSGFEVR